MTKNKPRIDDLNNEIAARYTEVERLEHERDSEHDTHDSDRRYALDLRSRTLREEARTLADELRKLLEADFKRLEADLLKRAR